MIGAVLLDLGGVLLDESDYHELMLRTLHRMIKERGGSVDLETLRHRRKELIRAQAQPLTRHLAATYLPDADDVQAAVDGMWAAMKGKDLELLKVRWLTVATLEDLSRRYPLGCVANQNRTVRALLKKQDLEAYFKAVIISEEAGVSKPDPAIFSLALERGGWPPATTVMVGDRIDNDVVPARKLGMRTVRYRTGIFADQEPRGPAEQADAEIDDLSELAAVLDGL